MKWIVLLMVSGLVFCNIEYLKTTYGDTTKISLFHKNGKIKQEGIKVKKFRDGKWRYYDENGFLVKVEYYKFGKKINTMDLRTSK